MNYDRVPKGLRWMQTTSFFHAAYEGLLVNELRYLQLIEHKVGSPSSLLPAIALTWSVLSSVRPGYTSPVRNHSLFIWLPCTGELKCTYESSSPF
jgi:hypothetical protein